MEFIFKIQYLWSFSQECRAFKTTTVKKILRNGQKAVLEKYYQNTGTQTNPLFLAAYLNSLCLCSICLLCRPIAALLMIAWPLLYGIPHSCWPELLYTYTTHCGYNSFNRSSSSDKVHRDTKRAPTQDSHCRPPNNQPNLNTVLLHIPTQSKRRLCALVFFWRRDAGPSYTIFITTDIFYNKTVHWSVSGVHDCAYHRHRQD